MARRPSKHLRPARPLSAGHQQAETRGERRWLVRSVPGAAATKAYRCPGCQQAITAGTPHQVVWPAEPSLGSDRGVDERRHWHTGCWRQQR